MRLPYTLPVYQYVPNVYDCRSHSVPQGSVDVGSAVHSALDHAVLSVAQSLHSITACTAHAHPIMVCSHDVGASSCACASRCRRASHTSRTFAETNLRPSLPR